METDELDIIRLKQREVTLLRAKLALIKNHGLAFYRPHEKQHLYHQSAAKRRGVFAGNRFGKSEASAAETVAWFVGERTWYKYDFPIYGMREGKRVVVDWHHGHEDHPLVRQGIPRHATKQLIITTDWKKVDIVWTSPLGDPPGKLWKFIPADRKVSTKKNHEGIIDQVFDEESGAVIRFTTEQAYLKNPQSVESTDNDRIGVDEPIVEDMWKGAARGLVDRGGTGDFTLTSLRERWIYDYFNDPELDQKLKVERFSVRATMDDNPFNDPVEVERYMADLTEEERECRRLGLPLELSGLVYKEFARERHVLKDLPQGWTSWTEPPKDWTIYAAIDVHEQTPQAAMFVAVPPKGRPIIYDEIWRSCVADELADEVRKRLDGYTVGFIKCDPRAWLEDPTFKVSMASRFFAKGLYVQKASKALTFGITHMRGILGRRHIEPATGKEVPEVYFSPNVKRTLWELSRYHYDKENKPIDKDDHFMECMYRIFINALVHIPFASSKSIPDFDIPMTRSALRDFDVDARMFDEAVRVRN